MAGNNKAAKNKKNKKNNKKRKNILTTFILLISITALCLVIGIYYRDNHKQKEDDNTVVLNVDSTLETLSVDPERIKSAILEHTTRAAENYEYPNSFSLDIPFVSQYPELPTGCEITALTTVLNYLGYNVDKLTMADYYLDKGKMGEVSPYKAFVGNPRDEDSCGAFAPVLVNSVTKYLKSQRSYMNVYNITGAEYNELLDYVDDGHPVLVWETMYMKEPYESCTWNIDGENIMWLSREHAMVLIGYTQSTYIMADPLRGICEYDKELVETRYKSMGKQAIVIY